jgi:hypothetical protein
VKEEDFMTCLDGGMIESNEEEESTKAWYHWHQEHKRAIIMRVEHLKKLALLNMFNTKINNSIDIEKK